MSAYSDYEAGYDAALEAVADGKVDAAAAVEKDRADARRARKSLGQPAVSRSEVDNARLTVASLAISATSSDAEAVDVTRDVLAMLGIGGAA